MVSIRLIHRLSLAAARADLFSPTGEKVASKGPDAFEFSLPGAPAGTKPLRFERQN